MIRLCSNHFCAAVVLSSGDVVTRAAPILRYMLGWRSERVMTYALRRGWHIELVE